MMFARKISINLVVQKLLVAYGMLLKLSPGANVTTFYAKLKQRSQCVKKCFLEAFWIFLSWKLRVNWWWNWALMSHYNETCFKSHSLQTKHGKRGYSFWNQSYKRNFVWNRNKLVFDVELLLYLNDLLQGSPTLISSQSYKTCFLC